MELKIERLAKKEVKKVAEIASENFSGLREKQKAVKWIACNLNAYPRMQYFVIKSKKEIAGYILWIEKGGFRSESVWELEQTAVKKSFQEQGIGTELINQSLEEVKKYLQKRKSSLKSIEITTGVENRVQNIYKKTLNAKIECVIKDLFRGDEVIMIARFK